MKIRSFLGWALLIASAAISPAAEQGERNLAAQMAVNVDVQEQFFAKYPDLADEREVVATAARSLAEAGAAPDDDEATAAKLAAGARALLAQRSPQDWQRKAVSLFPELGLAGSEFNTLFVRHYRELQKDSPLFMEEPSWPVLLAKRCADELRAPPVASPSEPTPAPAAPSVPATRAGFWSSLCNLAILLAVIVQPARWLLRFSRERRGVDEPRRLWQTPLRPAAWAYLAVAFIALCRTFWTNADQRFIDRFGITLLVSLLAGAAAALPAYAIALAFAVRRRSLLRSGNADAAAREKPPGVLADGRKA